MKDYLPLIVSIVAGLFAIAAAVFSWKLKQSSEQSQRKISQRDKSHSELKSLYIKIHEMLEELIKETKKYNNSNLSSDFSKLTAEVRIIASEEINTKYKSVIDLYHNWARLYVKAYPPAKDGYHIIQAPDPTLQYKEPETKAYDSFYHEYENLIQSMRDELAIT